MKEKIIAERRAMGVPEAELHRGLGGAFIRGTARRRGPVIVWGPPGCGKTRNAEKLRKHFGCARIVDGWSRGDRQPLRDDDLVLTCEMMAADPRAICFADAMGQMGEAA